MSAIDPVAHPRLVDALTALAISAAAAIRPPQRSRVSTKADGSPVTAADEAAEAVICEGLRRLAPGLSIISEEAAAHAAPAVASGPYFLVDPLDGTREFIDGSDEYTVNIALVGDGAPVAGVIAAPALGLVWRGIVGRGAERLEFSSQQVSAPQPIHTRTPPENELVVMVSRSHLNAPTQAYLDALPHARRVACGSSLKFCRLAEGEADHYARLGPTHDWDVAAGHAILAAAGGSMRAPDGTALAYGTPRLLIPSFLAWGSKTPAGAAALALGR